MFKILTCSLRRLSVKPINFDKESKVVQIKLVQQYPNFIKYIKNPSKNVQKEAVLKNSNSIFHIINPSTEAQNLYWKKELIFIRDKISNIINEMESKFK